jgi:soluble lytic murein transglycosylase-like protein
MRSAKWQGSMAAILLLALGVADLQAQVQVTVRSDGRPKLSNQQTFQVAPAPTARVDPQSDLLEIIESNSRQFDLDPLLIRAMIQVESAYDARAVSRKGAIGLMQLMPATAAELRVDPYDPADNVRGGSRYMRQLLDQFDDDLVLALAGYNAGPRAVSRYDGVPPYDETRNYVRRVLRLYQGSDFADIPSARLGASGRKTYLVREGGRLVMTTTPPGR